MGTARAHDMGKRGTEGWDGGARETGKRKGASRKITEGRRNQRGRKQTESGRNGRWREKGEKREEQEKETT